MRLIDADELLKRIKDYPYGYRGMIENDIAQMQTIEPKHGRWEYTDYGGVGNWHCSECHNIVLGVNGFPNLTNYCACCGARMREVEE